MAETPFSLVCTISRSIVSDIQAMRDSLATETESESFEDNAFCFRLNEANAKDLRAMWNTRVRGLIAVDSLIHMIDNIDN